ncbi:MAG TPA: hypothetical protein VI997_04445 [Candidatus Thermoplasmatota archaeon]|nr:hypothetical protein [Candidatus Thermoplasmatota archaeon]
MTQPPRPARCRTCGATFALRPYADDDGVWVTPAPYCSIHCEHYAGLARASADTQADS